MILLADAANMSFCRKINNPAQVQELSDEQLAQLAEELRQCIINTVSVGGGHLAPSLGVIELTLALFKCFNLDHDRLVWDVGHQAYAHKNSDRTLQ